MFSKQVENTGGKGEIAHYEQFLIFSTLFWKDLYCKPVKTRGLFGKGLSPILRAFLFHLMLKNRMFTFPQFSVILSMSTDPVLVIVCIDP